MIQMDKPKKGCVVFLDAGTINGEDLDLSSLEKVAGSVRYYSQTSRGELLDRDPEAWCVIVNKVALNRDFFNARPALKLVCVCATGTNNVDLDAARECGIAVANCRGYSTDSVAQHTLMLMLVLARNFHRYQRDIDAQEWSRSPIFCLNSYPIGELAGRKLGVVGYGEIGRRVERLAMAFGMEVLLSERPGKKIRAGRMDFAEVIASSDFISVHCPLTEDTFQLFDRNVFAQMATNAFLVNTSRGDLINEIDLLAALTAGEIAGAALDVLSQEPPPENHPLVGQPLPNLILTPHCAWASRAAQQVAIGQIAENMQSWLDGGALRRVV